MCACVCFTYIWIPNIDTRGCMGSVTRMPAAPDHLRHHRIPERQRTNIDHSSTHEIEAAASTPTKIIQRQFQRFP